VYKRQLEDPIQTAVNLLSPLSGIHPHLRITRAGWFFRKDPTVPRPLLVTFGSAAERNVILQSCHLLTRNGISKRPDLPISKRSNPKGPLPVAAAIHLPHTPCPLAAVSTPNSTFFTPTESPNWTPTKGAQAAVNPSHTFPKMLAHPTQIQRSTSTPNLAASNCPASTMPKPTPTATQPVPAAIKRPNQSARMGTHPKVLPGKKVNQGSHPAVRKNFRVSHPNSRPPSSRPKPSLRGKGSPPGLQAISKVPPLMSVVTRPTFLITTEPHHSTPHPWHLAAHQTAFNRPHNYLRYLPDHTFPITYTSPLPHQYPQTSFHQHLPQPHIHHPFALTQPFLAPCYPVR
jgi:hypothetical protein